MILRVVLQVHQVYNSTNGRKTQCIAESVFPLRLRAPSCPPCVSETILTTRYKDQLSASGKPPKLRVLRALLAKEGLDLPLDQLRERYAEENKARLISGLPLLLPRGAVTEGLFLIMVDLVKSRLKLERMPTPREVAEGFSSAGYSMNVSYANYYQRKFNAERKSRKLPQIELYLVRPAVNKERLLEAHNILTKRELKREPTYSELEARYCRYTNQTPGRGALRQACKTLKLVLSTPVPSGVYASDIQRGHKAYKRKHKQLPSARELYKIVVQDKGKNLEFHSFCQAFQSAKKSYPSLKLRGRAKIKKRTVIEGFSHLRHRDGMNPTAGKLAGYLRDEGYEVRKSTVISVMRQFRDSRRSAKEKQKWELGGTKHSVSYKEFFSVYLKHLGMSDNSFPSLKSLNRDLPFERVHLGQSLNRINARLLSLGFFPLLLGESGEVHDLNLIAALAKAISDGSQGSLVNVTATHLGRKADTNLCTSYARLSARAEADGLPPLPRLYLRTKASELFCSELPVLLIEYQNWCLNRTARTHSYEVQNRLKLTKVLPITPKFYQRLFVPQVRRILAELAALQSEAKRKMEKPSAPQSADPLKELRLRLKIALDVSQFEPTEFDLLLSRLNDLPPHSIERLAYLGDHLNPPGSKKRLEIVAFRASRECFLSAADHPFDRKFGGDLYPVNLD